MADRLKRLFDVAGALAGVVLAAPIMLAAALAVRLSLGRPVLFRQRRIGRGDRVFVLYKFRTMTDAPDGDERAELERTTATTRFLRSSSIDELPELFNVLRGDMSLVGPRPLLVEYLKHYTARESRRHEVRPGLTGWAQINGRNAVSWDERLENDVWYVENRSFMLDLRILLLTLGKVLRREGITHRDDTTMPRLDAVRRS